MNNSIKAAANKVYEVQMKLENQQARDRQYFKETSIEVSEAWKIIQLPKVEFKVKDSTFICSDSGVNIVRHVGHLNSNTIDELRLKIIEYLKGIEESIHKDIIPTPE